MIFGTTPKHREPEYKIACFSENKDSIPMWAYYANNHQGICLEYDVQSLTGDNAKLKEAFCKVHYSEYRPRDIDVDDGRNRALIVKGSQWAHEHEWRLICKPKGNFVDLPCLSAVYLGVNFLEDDNAEEKLDKLIKAIKKCGRDIKLYAGMADPEKYALMFAPLTMSK